MDGARTTVNQQSPAELKIRLFRSLFRGREDVYPRRFESRKTGKSGYAPACANEWVRGICEKPRIKCAECAHRRFLPVTDDVIRWHLSVRAGGGWTKRVSSWRSISTKPIGRTTPRPSLRFANGSNSRPPWSGLDPDEVGTSGSSSKRRSQRRWLDGSGRMSSQKPWKDGRT